MQTRAVIDACTVARCQLRHASRLNHIRGENLLKFHGIPFDTRSSAAPNDRALCNVHSCICVIGILCEYERIEIFTGWNGKYSESPLACRTLPIRLDVALFATIKICIFLVNQSIFNFRKLVVNPSSSVDIICQRHFYPSVSAGIEFV